MNEEDLKKLPQSIEAWKVAEFLEGLGISHTDVFDMHVGVRSVEISMYARDENGRRFRSADGETAAQHKLSIPYVGPWKRPTEEVDPHRFRPIGRKPDGSLADDCLYCPYPQDNKKAHPDADPDPKDLSLEHREQHCGSRLGEEAGGYPCERDAGHTGSHYFSRDDGKVLTW